MYLQSQFDSAFEALMGKAQDVMNVVKAILKDAQGGSLPDLQLQITQAIEELQRVCTVQCDALGRCAGIKAFLSIMGLLCTQEKSTAAEARSQITPRVSAVAALAYVHNLRMLISKVPFFLFQ
jgi:hypothetical protein